MPICIAPVRDSKQLDLFIKFPWVINRGDPNWVPPFLKERREKLDPLKNLFWKTAERELFLAVRDGLPVGTIAAIIDHHHNQLLGKREGLFGFFDCLDEQPVADGLLRAAEAWLRDRKMSTIRGPYNPSPTDECGVLVEGFQTRPALLEAHNPPYYAALFEKAGYGVGQELVARMAIAGHGASKVEEILSEKLMRVVEKLRQRNDIKLRRVNLKRWEEEINLACAIYNKALSPLPGYTPVPQGEFKAFADAFKPILDSDLALIAEVGGVPAAFALALPDITGAFQKANGHMGPLAVLYIWFATRKPKRGTFKILMVLPEYQNRGLETLLVLEIARAAYNKGYREMDMSLTGSENEKSNRFQENLGYRVYRRYYIFEKPL